MNISQLLSGGSLLALAGIALKALFDWFTTRRGRRAGDELAEGSVGPSLVERSFAASDAQIVFLERANANERASYERRIRALEGDVERLTTERDSLYRTVDEMRRQATAMQDQLNAMKAQLDRLGPRETP